LLTLLISDFTRRVCLLKSETKLSKIHRSFLRYTAKPDPRHLSDQDRLDPEPGRTPAPRLEPDRLSRDTQIIRIPLLVNENLQIFVNPAREPHAPSPQRTFLVSANRTSALVVIIIGAQSGIGIYVRAPPISANFWLLDYVPYVERGRVISINFFHQTIFDPADFFRGLLGANVSLPNVKNHVLNKLERVSQH
jgi:hypothetical protein